MTDRTVFQCRTYTPDGKLKETIPHEEVSRRFWEKFHSKKNKGAAMRAPISFSRPQAEHKPKEAKDAEGS